MKAEPLPRRTRWPGLSRQQQRAIEAQLTAEAAPVAEVLPPAPPPGKAKPLLRPVPLLPTSESAILNNLICREMLDPSGPLDPPSPTLRLLRETIQTIAVGGDITPYQRHLEQVAANQPEKAELVLAQLNQINDERIPRLLEMQDISERAIVQATRRRDIDVNEVLAAWRLANQELSIILKAKQDSRSLSLDGKTAVDKISSSQQSIDQAAAVKWEHTSPQGREIIRKKLWALKQEVTTTTTTSATLTAEMA